MVGRPSSYTDELANEKVEIYGLIDPRDGTLRYVGKANCAHKRLQSHLRDAKRRDTPVYRWIRKLSALALVPTVQVLHTCRQGNWAEMEIAIIAHVRASGVKLLNVAEGGNQPVCPLDVLRVNGSRTLKFVRNNNIRRAFSVMDNRLLKSRKWMSTEARAKFVANRAHFARHVARCRQQGCLDLLERNLGDLFSSLGMFNGSRTTAA